MAYGAAAGGIAKILVRLLRKHGLVKGAQMARKLGLPTSKIKAAVKKVGGGRRAQPMDPKVVAMLGKARGRSQAQPMDPRVVEILRRARPGGGRVPLPGVRETGASQLDRISRAGRTQQTLPPQVGRGPYEGTPADMSRFRPPNPAGSAAGRGGVRSEEARRFFDRRMGGATAPRPKVPQAYKRALKGTPLMKMLNRVPPAERAMALKLLMQMGALGAAGGMTAKMISDREKGAV